MRAQRALALLLTVLFFGLVIFGLGALFAVFHHRFWGYAVGVAACVVMTCAGVRQLRRDAEAVNDAKPPAAGKPASSGRGAPGKAAARGTGATARSRPKGSPGGRPPGRTGRR